MSSRNLLMVVVSLVIAAVVVEWSGISDWFVLVIGPLAWVGCTLAFELLEWIMELEPS